MTPCGLIIEQATIMGSCSRTCFLFANKDDALFVHERLKDATTRYHDRANDRERIFTFDALTGPASIDVSSISAFWIDNALGDGRAEQEEWNRQIGKMRRLGEGADLALSNS